MGFLEERLKVSVAHERRILARFYSCLLLHALLCVTCLASHLSSIPDTRSTPAPALSSSYDENTLDSYSRTTRPIYATLPALTRQCVADATRLLLTQSLRQRRHQPFMSYSWLVACHQRSRAGMLYCLVGVVVSLDHHSRRNDMKHATNTQGRVLNHINHYLKRDCCHILNSSLVVH